LVGRAVTALASILKVRLDERSAAAAGTKPAGS